jgi:uridine kinase
MEMLGQNHVADHQRKVVCITQDSFYKELNDHDQAKAAKGLYNFDHPDAFDDAALEQSLKEIISGKPVRIPQYDYVNNCRKENEFQVVHNADVVLVEGILVFYFDRIRDLFDMKLFVDTDADTRLSRRGKLFILTRQ